MDGQHLTSIITACYPSLEKLAFENSDFPLGGPAPEESDPLLRGRASEKRDPPLRWSIPEKNDPPLGKRELEQRDPLRGLVPEESDPLVRGGAPEKRNPLIGWSVPEKNDSPLRRQVTDKRDTLGGTVPEQSDFLLGGRAPEKGYPSQFQGQSTASETPVGHRGLECLAQIEELFVHQKVELGEGSTEFETNNKYKIKNSNGQEIYCAKEDTTCCTRTCCSSIRSFEMEITDNLQNEVIHLSRPLSLGSCLFPCFLQSIDVTSPLGNVIGSVHQEWSIFPKFKICNASGDIVLRIEGSFFYCAFYSDLKFKVMSHDGSSEVGKICKQRRGTSREAFTDDDHFSVSFPIDLDVRIKATLIGALFLIDFMFFEKRSN